MLKKEIVLSISNLAIANAYKYFNYKFKKLIFYIILYISFSSVFNKSILYLQNK